MNIIFMGTPDFAAESLKAIIEKGHNIMAVVTNPDRPKGRGMKMIATPVKEVAIEKNIPVYQPLKVRGNEDFIETLKSLNPDVICVVAYGKILPKEILDIPKYGCINVHASLLPKYRGAAPIQWAVLNGDKITGVTTMYMDVGMDTGDMILKEEVQIGEDETTGELWERLSVIGGNLLVRTLDEIENGTVKRIPQGEDFTIAPMLSKEMAKIDWQSKNAKEIKNLVRGLNPFMGAYCLFDGKKIKFWKVRAFDEDDVELGKVLGNMDFSDKEAGDVLFADSKKGLFIKTVQGVISVEEIQGENAKRMNVGDFLRGFSIEDGCFC